MGAAITAGEAPVTIDEVRAWMRMGAGQDDAVIAALIRAASNLCEAFVGQMLILREVSEEMPVTSGWMRLAKRPVTAIVSVTGLSADGPDFPMNMAMVAQDIARDGTAQIRIEQPGSAGRVRVVYRAGMAEGPNGVPESLRQGIVRLAAHLHAARDGADGEPPAIISALWQPWRRRGIGR